MDDAPREHPDEGTIHAWLDGALDDVSARAIAAHVASCRACTERVAEARGLIAGASRIVGALDAAPAITAPAWGQGAAVPPPAGGTAGAAPGAASGVIRGSVAPRWLRVTPARAAVAATVLVALGLSLTYKRAAVDTDATRAEHAAPERTLAAPGATPAPTSTAAPRGRDAVLDSAIARNLAQAQPPRRVEPAETPAPLVAPVTTNPAAVADRGASAKVAVARAAALAGRDSAAGTTPDQLASGANVASRAMSTRVAAAAAARANGVDVGRSGSPVVARAEVASAAPVPRVGGVTPAPECYRVESANGTAAAWGPVALPLVVALDAAGRARVLAENGAETGAQAVVTRAGDDSLLFQLRRLGYEGTLALGAPGEARAGVMRSRPLANGLEEVVATAVPPAPAAAEVRAPARKRVAKAVPPAQAPASSAASAAAAADAQRAAAAAPAVPVVARRIGCPG